MIEVTTNGNEDNEIFPSSPGRNIAVRQNVSEVVIKSKPVSKGKKRTKRRASKKAIATASDAPKSSKDESIPSNLGKGGPAFFNIKQAEESESTDALGETMK